MQGFYEFMNWLDNWEGIEQIAMAIIGFSMYALVWLWGFSCARRLGERQLKTNNDIIQDIIYSKHPIEIKLAAINKLTSPDLEEQKGE